MTQPTHSAPIVLEQAIARGKERIDSITLRKPAAGELRGLKLADLLQGDVNAVIRLVPRISQPTLTEPEVAALDVVDLTACADEIVVFANAGAQGAGRALPAS
ncbi:phage tail assembly protein [Pseudomonas lalucatii]|nr:phage tail assembly protein [Pseudomonas lalucatii]